MDYWKECTMDESFEDSVGMEQTMPWSQGMVKKVSYDDGKTWIDISELENIGIVD